MTPVSLACVSMLTWVLSCAVDNGKGGAAKDSGTLKQEAGTTSRNDHTAPYGASSVSHQTFDDKEGVIRGVVSM